jgi:alpha-glutamyl/putrescinyl thymine pyrophosphorylase clade 1
MPQLDMQVLADMRYWILERESVRQLKEGGAPKPWTQDKILQSYRFCNVRREDDKVTRWFAANWRQPKFWSARNFVPAIMLGRTINWPETLEEIGFPHAWDSAAILAALDKRQQRGDKVYTGAYMITAGPTGVRKNAFVIGNADTYFFSPPILDPRSLERSWKAVMNYPCVGPFIAAQIIADLKQTSHLREAKDWWDWAGLGPGSTRGLHRLYGRNLTASLPQDVGLGEMREVREALDLPFKLCLQDIQNCLCEFDKWSRVKNGQGKPRSGYPGK